MRTYFVIQRIIDAAYFTNDKEKMDWSLLIEKAKHFSSKPKAYKYIKALNLKYASPVEIIGDQPVKNKYKFIIQFVGSTNMYYSYHKPTMTYHWLSEESLKNSKNDIIQYSTITEADKVIRENITKRPLDMFTLLKINTDNGIISPTDYQYSVPLSPEDELIALKRSISALNKKMGAGSIIIFNHYYGSGTVTFRDKDNNWTTCNTLYDLIMKQGQI